MAMGGGMMAGGIGMSIAGDVLAADEAGRVAEIMRNLPQLEKVDFNKEQAATIAGNLASLPEATKFAQAATTADVGITKSALEQMIPDYEGMVKRATDLITAHQEGKILPDDLMQIYRQSAAKALAGGYAGSGMHGALTARDIGKTEYEITNQGLAQAQAWIGQQRGFIKPLSVSSMMLTPEFRIKSAMDQNEALYRSALTAALGKTTPGKSAYWAQTLQSRGGQAMGGGMSMMGGGMGGMGGGGGGGGGVDIPSYWSGAGGGYSYGGGMGYTGSPAWDQGYGSDDAAYLDWYNGGSGDMAFNPTD